MSEKQKAGLEARKQGIKLEEQAKLGEPAVAKLIRDGLYSLVYDGKDLQSAGPRNSNPDSTWYNFDIMAGGKNVGFFHVHPSGNRFFAGNLRLKDGSAFGNYQVGQARDWQWLANRLADRLPK